MAANLAPIPSGIFDEFNQLQRDLERWFAPLTLPTSIRAVRGAFPAVNIGSTPEAFEVYCFVPGCDPKALEVTVERGVLTIAGERNTEVPEEDEDGVSVYQAERFSGRFRRVLSLSEDCDPARVEARCRDGVLRITARKRENAKPRQISIK